MQAKLELLIYMAFTTPSHQTRIAFVCLKESTISHLYLARLHVLYLHDYTPAHIHDHMDR